MAMRSALFDAALQENESGHRWTMQSDKMLRGALGPEIVARSGAMVAYQGQVDFSYERSGGIGKALKRAASSEGDMMRVRGEGEVFFADGGKNVFLLQLEGDAITVNSPSLLAFDSSIQWDITRLQGAGFMAGGLFNVQLQGEGTVGLVSDGPPMLLDCSRQPTYVDPQAAVCWSANLAPGIKNDFKLGSLVGRGSGESFQLAFHGPGFVVVQPSEGDPVVQTS